MEQQLCTVATLLQLEVRKRQGWLTSFIVASIACLCTPGRLESAGCLGEKRRIINQSFSFMQPPQWNSLGSKRSPGGAVPYLSSPVDGSRSKLCMISSSERKEDGCPGERVKDTLLSEVHLPEEREQTEHAFEGKERQAPERIKRSLEKVSPSWKKSSFLRAAGGSARRILSLSTWRGTETGWLGRAGRGWVSNWASSHLPVVQNVCIHNFYLQGQRQHEDVQGHTEVPQVNGVQVLAAFQAAQNFP